MRCKACNAILQPHDYNKSKSKNEEEDEKYCTKCKFASTDIRPIKEYQHTTITESLVDSEILSNLE